MVNLFLRSIFFAMLMIIAWERICDALFLWIPGIDLAKKYVTSFSEQYTITLAAIFSISGISTSLLAQRKLSQGTILVLLLYGFFELVVADPFWLILLYTFFVGLAFLLHNTIEEDALKELFEPLQCFFSKGGWRFVPLPVLAVLMTLSSYENLAPPTQLRTVHPAPPDSFVLKGELITLQNLENPYRHLETEKRSLFDKYITEGGVIYFQNCFFCHGAKQDGQGHFAKAFNPKPANFTDPGTIAQLRESYLFWRIATGGPGLPEHAAPWDSVMPVWSNYLNKEEIWKVILFIYEASGQKPKKF